MDAETPPADAACRPPGGYRIDYEEELNPAQLEVVLAGGGPLLVIAGAGSGKTRTLTYRVARLLETGVRADEILLVTFTNKAAREMMGRVAGLLDAGPARLWGGTFHHIAHLILRRHADRLGIPPSFSILDREDARDLMTEVIDAAKPTFREGIRFPKPNLLVDIASFAANTLAPVDQVISDKYSAHLDLAEEIGKILEGFAARKRALGFLDFDDLLVQWRRLLLEPGDTSEAFARRFRHLLVDEYQDTNRLQGEIIDLLARGHRNLTVVGDDAQSIYAFRGAHFANIYAFPERYPDARVFRLETNYRSTPQVLALANASIAHNRRQFPKALVPARPAGVLPVVAVLDDGTAQAEFVARRLAELLAGGVPPQEIAVLYRAHYHALELQMELARRQVPFVVRSGLRFFEQAHVKDLLAYARVAGNPRDALAWRRLIGLCPGLGKKTAATVSAALEQAPDPLGWAASDAARAKVPKKGAAAWKQLVATVRDLAEPGLRSQPARLLELALYAGYVDYLGETYTNAATRREELEQLVLFARRYDTLEALLADVALQGEAPGDERRAREADEAAPPAVVLSTIHQAKGLEWRTVFLIGLSQGGFPDGRSLNSVTELEEERRLFYVGVTRAKDQLYLTCPLFVPRRDWSLTPGPSEFIAELAPETYEEWKLSYRGGTSSVARRRVVEEAEEAGMEGVDDEWGEEEGDEDAEGGRTG
ncbi:MAG: ATP-dependent helicase [Planctomycetes bacterium]|nr:ATP-dependent helicase [Planctomycetota bacterium]